ncbi:hypothetical protein C1J05_05860 [Sulfitobacter sp. JL08]|uniref:DUF1214 domain-containing protein n=1 Tax=Sulfitobacter sp. JL08 TaxID=2070369 RepID=UPI000E0BE2A5|nr:DUF1214 domain-containing protein [Sulfitobacter sp. JL08]AXI54077.1 hypothetical protein C1J05_05860 [Sulfitobacter sp. JL08]
MKEATVAFAVVLAGTTWFATQTIAQNDALTSELSTQEKMVHRRAVETAVWAMPLTNALAMRDGFAEVGCDYNVVCYFSKIQDYRAAVTTPNNTTPYVMAFWNIADGPVMIDVPPTEGDLGLWGTLMDIWQRPLADVGAKGRDKGAGASYLIVPEGYDGDTFDADYVLPQTTLNGYTLLRPIIPDASPNSLAAAEEFTKKLKIFDPGQPAQTQYLDVQGMDIDGVVEFDRSLFVLIDEFVQSENLEERDAVALGMLRRLGIEKGREFTPTERELEILDHAANEAKVFLQEAYFDNHSEKQEMGNGWTVLTPASSYETTFSWLLDSGAIALDDRGSSFFAFYTSAEEFNLTAPPTMYLLTSRDADDERLDGGTTYSLVVPPDVPVSQFWSVLVYDFEDATFLDGFEKYGVASTEDLEVNEDGSVRVVFGPELPDGVSESNYVPTATGGGWFPYFRFYGPGEALFSGDYQLPKIEKFIE